MQDHTLHLSSFSKEDLFQIWQIGFSKPAPAWKEWNAPYFDDYQPYPTFEDFQASDTYQSLTSPNTLGIFVDSKPIGSLSRYWECQATRWLEIGIVIYDTNYWSGGYGTAALRKWIDKTFADFPEIERVGLTTWSGNIRMMKAAEKLGMTQEACIRKVRYWQGHYYDSVKYGILIEEWQKTTV